MGRSNFHGEGEGGQDEEEGGDDKDAGGVDFVEEEESTPHPTLSASAPTTEPSGTKLSESSSHSSKGTTSIELIPTEDDEEEDEDEDEFSFFFVAEAAAGKVPLR